MVRQNSALPNARLLIVLIVLLGFTAPLSTDMCLPALPTIANDFGVSYSAANLVIILFFAFFALFTLLAGPMSDRFGRKKVMLASLCIYLAGNIVCTAAPTFSALVTARAVSAAGAGGMLNSSTALIKDGFSGRERDKALSIVQVFQIVAPLVAPVIGAVLLRVFTWHASFFVLCCVAATEIVVAAFIPETQPVDERGASTIAQTFAMIPRILGNRAFAVMLLAVGCLQACFMAYLATSSYIYTVQFGVEPEVYSLFFAGSALVTMLAPGFYMKVLYNRFSPKVIYRGAQTGVLAGGILIIVTGIAQASGALAALGPFAPFVFWASFLIVAFSNAIARPLGTSILLRQHKSAGGTVSALINFGLYLIGLVGMSLGSLGWSNYIAALGGIVACLIVIAIVLFGICTKPGFGLVWEEPERDQ